MIGPCPKCKSEVREGNGVYLCQAPECGFKLGKIILGQVLDSSQASKLFREGRTDLLSGFVSKRGLPFPSRLVLDNSENVTFELPKADSLEAIKSQKTANSRAEGSEGFWEKNRKLPTKQIEFFNLIKILSVAALVYFGVVTLLHKKHTGQPIEYTIIYTTINGHYYEKEGNQKDLYSGFVTFEDGTRVPWADVKTKKMKVYPDELGIGTNPDKILPQGK